MVLAVAIVAVSVAVLTSIGTPRRPSGMLPAGSGVSQETLNDLSKLVQQVGRHILVVDPQMPSVATIENADELRTKNPYFYSNAQNGDRLLIWRDKAVLYSPTRDVVLSVLPVFVADVVNLNAPTSGQQMSDSKEVSLVEVRNGSGISGLGKTVAAKVQSNGMSVLPPFDARAKTRYAKTFIYVAPGKSLPQTAQKLKDLVGGEIVTSLPAEEGEMRGDVLVMIGLDAKR